MSRIIKTWRDPYDEGFSTCRRKEIEINPGLTVLVGCNGAGKSTLLENIKCELKEEKIPTFYFDNEKDGGSSSIGWSIYDGNVELAALQWTSSEGENISLNLKSIASKWNHFIKTGDNGDKLNKLAKILNEDEESTPITNERWILLDAIDSGYSIDNVIEMKTLFDIVLQDSKDNGFETYIVVVANEYELACNTNCFDVTEGKYITFNSYEDYKKFILHTRKKKNKRY